MSSSHTGFSLLYIFVYIFAVSLFLTSCSIYTRHANFDLMDVFYLQNVVFSIKKGSNGQNYSSSDSDHPTKKFRE